MFPPFFLFFVSLFIFATTTFPWPTIGRQGFLFDGRVLIAPWRWSTPSGCSIVLLLGSDEGNQFLCSLAMLLELLPSLAYDNPHLDEDWSEKVVAIRFDYCLRCHA